ncbi:MAG: carbonic anhydrase [Syntrophobacteraceae bacterium]
MKRSGRLLGWLPVTIALALVIAVAPFLWASGPGPGLSADQAMTRLQEGNARFSGGSVTHPNCDPARRSLTASQGQAPFVTILGCSDSRVPVELLFDSGIGDLFVIRVAGNVADTDEIGSMEYGVDHLGTPLLVVLGHTKCGAVTATVQEASVHGHIPSIVGKIEPAVEKAKSANPSKGKEALVDDAIKANIWQAIEDTLSESETIRKAVVEGKLKVVGAMYDIDKGTVAFLGNHPNQAKILAGQ